MPPLPLLSGLLSGWILGVNDSSPILGPAVGSKMLTYRTTAVCCALFLILGALSGGQEPSQTFASIGAPTVPMDVFLIALSAAVSVALMTLTKTPVSTVQAMAGALLGWGVVSGCPINRGALLTAGLVWLVSPALSALLAVGLYKFIACSIKALHINIFKLDRMIRNALFLACGFTSYALGANNISGTMGIFLPLSPFSELTLAGISISSAQQLYLVGGTVAAVGMVTWGRNLAEATGDGIFKSKASPVQTLVVVLTQGLVLCLFTSQGLSAYLTGHGLPAMPLVPLSGCQSLIGAMMGLSLMKKGVGPSWRSVGKLTTRWLATPILSFLLTGLLVFACHAFM
ncbi:inorganic phosphate transporter [Desulfoluna sp.]|uniref:inorganic phosphate transporter n=1 Tax=Desulfoluna sp. TaxID=2045199 RepID=UPI00260F075B|nr:inorganic phosphate transporter [Desulfoluna sp.]